MANKPIMRGIRLDEHYDSVLGDISSVIDMAKRSAARSVNFMMTAAYWLIGRRIIEFEQTPVLWERQCIMQWMCWRMLPSKLRPTKKRAHALR